MIDIKRKKGESFEAFMRRFKKRIMQSGLVLQYKKVRFHRKDENKQHRQKSALYRLSAAKDREYLKKIGRLQEEERPTRR